MSPGGATKAVDKVVDTYLADSKEVEEKSEDGLGKNEATEPQKGDGLPREGATGSLTERMLPYMSYK